MKKLEYLNELQVDAEKLFHSYGVIVTVSLVLRWVACFAALLLLILDGTKWRLSNMWTSLLAPYLLESIPLVILQFFRREFGKWISLLIILLRLFFPTHFPESLEIPGSTLLLIVTAPGSLLGIFRSESDDLRDLVIVSLYVSFYLLDKHTKACGGYKNSFTQKDKLTYTICLYILFAYPIWTSLTYPFSY